VLTIYQLPTATAASPAMVLNEGGALISIKVRLVQPLPVPVLLCGTGPLCCAAPARCAVRHRRAVLCGTGALCCAAPARCAAFTLPTRFDGLSSPRALTGFPPHAL
jgi:hypothetical protein